MYQVCTMDMFLVLFRCKWYGMVYHCSSVPFPFVLVLRCTYYFVSSIETFLFKSCFVTVSWISGIWAVVWEHHHHTFYSLHWRFYVGSNVERPLFQVYSYIHCTLASVYSLSLYSCNKFKCHLLCPNEAAILALLVSVPRTRYIPGVTCWYITALSTKCPWRAC